MPEQHASLILTYSEVKLLVYSVEDKLQACFEKKASTPVGLYNMLLYLDDVMKEYNIPYA